MLSTEQIQGLRDAHADAIYRYKKLGNEHFQASVTYGEIIGIERAALAVGEAKLAVQLMEVSRKECGK